MAAKIKELDAAPAPEAPKSAPAAARRSVFLGHMTDALQDDRADLRARLTDCGVTVLPPAEDDPIDQASLNEAWLTHHEQVDALVMMASETSPLWPRHEDGGFVHTQIQAARSAGLPCYLWLRTNDLAAVRNPGYRRFLETVAEQASATGLALSHESIDGFVSHIQQSLSLHRAPESGVEQLAVICSNYPQDEDLGGRFREAVREAVQDTRRELFVFDFSHGQQQIKLEKLGERIRDADTVVVLCFDQEWDWARGLLREINGLSELRRGHKAKLLIAGPQDRQGGLYYDGAFGFKTVDGVDLGLERFRELLKKELAAPKH